MTDLKKVILEINPTGIHSKQILTGFSLLEEKKIKIKGKRKYRITKWISNCRDSRKKNYLWYIRSCWYIFWRWVKGMWLLF